MSKDDLDKALSLIRENLDRGTFKGPPSADLLRAAEDALGFSLPRFYRQFVVEFGAGGVGSEEIYGLTTSNFTQATVPNAIWLTLRKRGNPGLPLPNSMIIIGEDGYGGYYVLDTAKAGTDGEPPVEMWEPWHTGKVDTLELVAPDFGMWLLDAVRFGLRDNDDEWEEANAE